MATTDVIPFRRKSTRQSRSAEKMVLHIRGLTKTLSDCSARALIAEAENLRSELLCGATIDAPEMVVAGIALACEAVRRSHGIKLYDVQMLAAIHLAHGRIAQMHTGEGKTFVAITAAAYFALAGKGVHVMTPNSYLAERDCELAHPVLQQLGMTVGLTPEQGETDVKRMAYDCDVTYGTGHEFGFDYLRDQLTLRSEAAAPLGASVLQQLRSNKPTARTTIQRGLVFAVVDEADSVMIDDAASPLVLCMAGTGPASDLEARNGAFRLAEELQRDEHFSHDNTINHVTLTDAGRTRCYADDVDVPAGVLQRPWTSYVEQALRAKYLFRRDVHYIIADDEVRIVDQSTGRIFEDRSWQDGLHQAIEVREQLPVTPEKESLAQISRQRFFRRYQTLCGMTGTAVGCEAEFAHVFRSKVAAIPLHRPSQRSQLPTRFFKTREAKLDAIVTETQRRNATGQPVLVGTQSINDSQDVATRLNAIGLEYRLLNGLQTAEEADIVALAGQKSAITISTNLAGRGTDISVADDVQQLGGLHVIIAECQLSDRMDRQLAGRCARQGQPGSVQTFVSAEDAVIVRFGAWLGVAIAREAGAGDEAASDFSHPLARLQKAAEKQQFQVRAQLLKQDIARDSLFGETT